MVPIDYASQEFATKYHYTKDDLGAMYHKHQTDFRVWAPTAHEVSLITYPTGHDGSGQHYPMHKSDQGTWTTSLPGDLDGIYYNYLVMHGQTKVEAVDPYAKACGVNGRRAMVVDFNRTNPDGWQQLHTSKLDHFTDAIIYELHIRDFTISKNAGMKYSGKYLGLTEIGTVATENVLTGLCHLKELGVTHIQMMPCFDFFTVDETRENPEYNWGYDPLNYNIPEGSYATDPYDGAVRIYEFKQMIGTLKQHGFRVVMDVVYNHTYHSTDSHLNRIVPGYYYRQDPHGNFTNGSGCGNELASERYMVSKMIIDSVCHWAREYKIDGFRFDLMGLLDINTINEIRSRLNHIDPTILIYGEGWTGGHSPLPDSLKAIKGNVGRLPGTGVFNDDIRDAIKGHVFFADQAGFVNGATGMEESLKSGIVAATAHEQVDYSQVLYSHFPWAAEPAQSINYVSAHDNLTLWDKLQKTNPDDSFEDLVAMDKMAAAIVLTSQGIPFLHSGSEFLRTKQGHHNSYNAHDQINRIDWSRKARFYDVFSYYQGLIKLRKAHPGLRMHTVENIKTKLRFLEMPESHMIGYIIEQAEGEPWQKIVVIFNANNQQQVINLPGENWVVVVNDTRAGVEKLELLKGSLITIPPLAAYVLVDEASYWRN